MQNKDHPMSMEEIMQLAASPVGQQLLHLLQQKNTPILQQAIRQASAGDLEGAKSALSSLLQDPEIKKQLEQMGR